MQAPCCSRRMLMFAARPPLIGGCLRKTARPSFQWTLPQCTSAPAMTSPRRELILRARVGETVAAKLAPQNFRRKTFAPVFEKLSRRSSRQLFEPVTARTVVQGERGPRPCPFAAR
eukprot:5969233-Pleurochrysis_carterae.AAC.2